MITKLDSSFIGIGDVRGFEFNQILESDNGYIYSVNDSGKIHYEIFEKKLTPLCIDFDNRIYSETDFKEIYPKSRYFGQTAWTCRSEEDAIKKLIKIDEYAAQRQAKDGVR